MFRRNRTPKPVPTPVDPAALTLGLRILADDRAAGDDWALMFFEDTGFDFEIAAYPTSWMRKMRIFHLGRPGPGDVPCDDVELPADYEVPAEFLRPRGEKAVAAEKPAQELPSRKILARFLTVNGFDVNVIDARYEGRARTECKGCGDEGRAFPAPLDDAKRYANEHAAQCHGFPIN